MVEGGRPFEENLARVGESVAMTPTEPKDPSLIVFNNICTMFNVPYKMLVLCTHLY